MVARPVLQVAVPAVPVLKEAVVLKAVEPRVELRAAAVQPAAVALQAVRRLDCPQRAAVLRAEDRLAAVRAVAHRAVAALRAAAVAAAAQ